jgi:hypothetical protein
VCRTRTRLVLNVHSNEKSEPSRVAIVRRQPVEAVWLQM